MDIFIFHTQNESAAIFSIQQISIAVVIPQVIKANSSFRISKINCFISMTIFSLFLFNNKGNPISGLDKLVISSIDIKGNNFVFTSPEPGIIVVGTLNGGLCSLQSSNIGEGSTLLHSIN
jgi:hypothetical protein